MIQTARELKVEEDSIEKKSNAMSEDDPKPPKIPREQGMWSKRLKISEKVTA